MSSLERSPKRAKIAGPVADEVDLVAKIISDPACQVSGPKEHRDMLVASLAHALAVPCNERHEYQTQLVQMVGQVLSDHAADWERKVTDSKTAVDAAAQKSTEAINIVEASTAMIQVQKEKISNESGVVKEASEAVTAAEKAVKIATKAVADHDGECQKTIQEQKSCASAYSECFTENSGGLTKASKALQKLESTMQEFHLEGSLRSALIPALRKSPAARGPFDVMAVEEADGVFKKHLEELQQQIDKADELKTEKVTAESAAHQTLTEANEKLAASKESLKNAKAELASLQRKHHELQKNAGTANDAQLQAATHQASEEKGLANAKDVLDVFTKLREVPR